MISAIVLLLTMTTAAVLAITIEESPTLFLITTSDPEKIQDEILFQMSAILQDAPVDTPIIQRLDRLTDQLVGHAQTNLTGSLENQLRFVVNGLSTTDLWKHFIEYDPTTGVANLNRFAASLLGLLGPGNSIGIDPYPGFLETHQAGLDVQRSLLEGGDGRNLTQELWDAYWDVVDVLGTEANTRSPLLIGSSAAAPFYQISYGYLDASNARAEGIFNNRCLARFNLGARGMLDPHVFRSALLQETWHCVQFARQPVETPSPTIDLLAVTMLEGVAQYLVHLTDPLLDDTDILFWRVEEWDAAVEREAEIVQEFETMRTSRDRVDWQEWIYLGMPLSVVPGAPSRCAYFVGYRAVQAYVNQLQLGTNISTNNATALARHLLELEGTSKGREEMFQAILLDVESSENNVPASTDAPSTSTDTSSSPSLSITPSEQVGWRLMTSVFAVIIAIFV